MKKNLIETKFKSSPGVGGQLLSRAVCLGAVILICSSAPAQNLFVSVSDAGGGKIFEFTPDGVQSTFASGLNPGGLAFDSAGNLFVVGGGPAIYKFSPEGVQSTFALGLSSPKALAVDPAGNLVVTDVGVGQFVFNIAYRHSQPFQCVFWHQKNRVELNSMRSKWCSGRPRTVPVLLITLGRCAPHGDLHSLTSATVPWRTSLSISTRRS